VTRSFVPSVISLSLTVVALLIGGTPVVAQQPSPPAESDKQETAKPDQEPEKEPTFEDEVTVVASTRTGRRVEDEPIRVEVVPQEEIDEKVFMTPGDVSMMLTETNGLRVQVTSPSLGAASVRVQGLSGRYTQVLADGLPLYGPPGNLRCTAARPSAASSTSSRGSLNAIVPSAKC
jgi:hypothetical protein